ncbi:MAG: MspA family porin [Nocardia sp.]|nr:MspA family porin [Nocardia sp.]
MSVYPAFRWSWAARAVVGLMTAGAAVGIWSPGAAVADVTVPLPDGHIDGPGIHIASSGERAVISPSLAANGAGRTAWVTGNVTVDIQTPPGTVGPKNGASNDPGTNDSSTHGASQVTVGYVVGCQVALGNMSASLGATLSTSPTVSGGISFPLAPGQVKWVQVDYLEMPTSGRYFLNYQDYSMDVQGCGGFAQARQFAVVEKIGPDFAKSTLYGRPFSLG